MASRAEGEGDAALTALVTEYCIPLAAHLIIAAVTLANKLSSRPGPTESTPRPFDANDERCLALLCSLLGPALERQMLRDDDFYRR